MLKSDSLSTQSLASCELLLWNFQVFQNTVKRFRYKYSILFNFQGPALFASWLTAYLFYHSAGSLSSTFFKFFGSSLCFCGPLRGALEYNTTPHGFCQPFSYKNLHSFLCTLYSAPKGQAGYIPYPARFSHWIAQMGCRMTVFHFSAGTFLASDK